MSRSDREHTPFAAFLPRVGWDVPIYGGEGTFLTPSPNINAASFWKHPLRVTQK